jgi:hypothetical protein
MNNVLVLHENCFKIYEQFRCNHVSVKQKKKQDIEDDKGGERSEA